MTACHHPRSWFDRGWWLLAAVTMAAVTRGPVYRVRFQAGPLHGDFVDDRWVQSTFLVIYLAAALGWPAVRRSSAAAKRWLLVASSLPLALLLAVAWAVDRGRALDQALLLLAGTLAACVLGVRLGVARLLGATAVGIHAVLAIGAFAVARHWALSRDVNGKWAGINFNRNSYAGPAMIGLLVVVALGAAAVRGGTRPAVARWVIVPAVPAAVADIAVLVHSASVTPLSGVAIGSVVLTAAWLLDRRRRTPTAGAVALAALVVAAIGWRGAFVVRDSAGRLGRSPTLEGRTLIWRVIRRFIRRRLVGGWGLNAVWTRPEIHYAFLNFGGGGYDVYEAHSGYYEVLLGGGLLAFAVLVVVFGTALWIAARWWVETDGALRAVPLFAVAYVAAVNLTETYVGANLLSWTLLTALVAASAAGRERVPPGSVSVRPR